MFQSMRKHKLSRLVRVLCSKNTKKRIKAVYLFMVYDRSCFDPVEGRWGVSLLPFWDRQVAGTLKLELAQYREVRSWSGILSVSLLRLGFGGFWFR